MNKIKENFDAWRQSSDDLIRIRSKKTFIKTQRDVCEELDAYEGTMLDSKCSRCGDKISTSFFPIPLFSRLCKICSKNHSVNNPKDGWFSSLVAKASEGDSI